MEEVELKVLVPAKAKTEGKIEIDLEFLAEAVVKLLKRDISERYKQTGKITDEDWKFCEKIDWHPVDELPLKEEFVKELEERKKGPFIKFNSVDEFFDSIK